MQDYVQNQTGHGVGYRGEHFGCAANKGNTVVNFALNRFIALPISIATMIFAGCASKIIVSEWTNTDYSSPSFKRIMVIGVTEQTAIRRNFEDRLAAELRKAGVDAVPSYRHIPETGKIAQERLLAAVEKTQADAAIITRLVRAEHRTEVSPGYNSAFPRIGLYGWYSSAWYAGFHTPARIYQYPVFFSETTMYDIVKDQVVWTAAIRTIDPENIEQATKNYVEAVVQALKQKNLLSRLPAQQESRRR
jgi:hypothetical protein